MDIRIEPIQVEQKAIFAQLMELRNYDFSEYEDTDVNECGYFGHSHIDDYWNGEGLFPYFIRVNDKIAGFALVCKHCMFIKGSNIHSIAEFFILKKYRRNGVGRYVAVEIFNKHKGQWEVLQLSNNVPAQRFWQVVITDYMNGAYQECGSLDENWVGFLFDNSCSK